MNGNLHKRQKSFAQTVSFVTTTKFPHAQNAFKWTMHSEERGLPDFRPRHRMICCEQPINARPLSQLKLKRLSIYCR